MTKQQKPQSNRPRQQQPKSFTQKSLADHLDGLAISIPKFFGFGKYNIKENTLLNLQDQTIPQFSEVADGVRICHREYIGDIISSPTANTFAVSVYAVNPGMAETFPWLSSIANQFQEYTFKGLVFEYRTTSADALTSTNTSLGTVCMAANYRSDFSGNFLTKQQMLESSWAYDAKPSETFVAPIECDMTLNPYNVLYTRGTNAPAGQDIKTYDMALLNVATSGIQGTSVAVGELWASYDVILRKPQSLTTLNPLLQFACYTFNSYTNANPFNGHTSVNDNISMIVTGNTISFPLDSAGSYLINMSWFGTSTAVTVPSITYTNGMYVANLQPFLGTTIGYNNSPPNGTTSTTVAVQLTVSVIPQVGLRPTLTLSGSGVLPSAGTSGFFQIVQLPYNLPSSVPGF